LKFCPKCGAMMVPVKKDDDTILRCHVCGYEERASKETLEKYKSVAKPDKKAKVVSTGMVSKASKAGGAKEEIEQAKDDYYELVLEQMGEYGE